MLTILEYLIKIGTLKLQKMKYDRNGFTTNLITKVFNNINCMISNRLVTQATLQTTCYELLGTFSSDRA